MTNFSRKFILILALNAIVLAGAVTMVLLGHWKVGATLSVSIVGADTLLIPVAVRGYSATKQLWQKGRWKFWVFAVVMFGGAVHRLVQLSQQGLSWAFAVSMIAYVILGSLSVYVARKTALYQSGGQRHYPGETDRRHDGK